AKLNVAELNMTSLSKRELASAEANGPKGLRDKPSLENSWFELPEKGTTLKTLYAHSDLYDAYPFLKDISIKPLGGMDVLNGTLGSYGGGVIKLAPQTLSGLKSTLSHEIQHAIQEHEGFSLGANTEMIAQERPNWKDLNAHFNDFNSTLNKHISNLSGNDVNKPFELRY